MTTRAESFGVKLNKANWTATPVMICDELGVVLSCFIKYVENRYTHNHTVRNYLHGLQNSGESMGDSDLHADFGPVTW